MKKTFLITALLATASAIADTNQKYEAIILAPGVACGQWASSANTSKRNIYIAWIMGYISGSNNANTSKQVLQISTSTVELYVDKYCRDNPLGYYTAAANELIEKVAKKPPEASRIK